MTDTIAHDCIVTWPNGKGETPCSREYFDLLIEREILKPNPDEDETLDDLPPDRYNRYCQIDNDLGVLQLNGYLGKSVRY